ncbi:synaptotagmin-5 [Strongylocentrotus purpuratus]|uniref:C2 domain-containing protein n=1 Tax=Strongylocentrotus purpuratus TaxID=7668 RepID=A0A7M7NZL4_STRPU|nr:synaptotagmin-5 [Strongylocentrotus purpuratus]
MLSTTIILGIACGIGGALFLISLYAVYTYSRACARCKEKTLREQQEAAGTINIAEPPKNFFIPKERIAVQPIANRIQSPPQKIESPNRSDPELNSLSTSDSSHNGSFSGSFESEFGTVKPELYPRRDDRLVMNQSDQYGISGSTIRSKQGKKIGRLHVKLKYDFNTSDFVIKVVEADHLPAMDIGGSSDPYVKISLEPDEERKIKQSVVQRRTLNPVWNEIFKFPTTYEELQEKTVRFSVFDFDKFSRHDAIGEVLVRINDVDVSRELDVWSELRSPQSRKEELGDILFSVSYLPTAERLTVVVLKARNLKTMDINGSSDPFVKVSLLQGGRRVKKKKTSVRKCNCNPTWNEAIIFNVPAAALNACSLELIVMDYDLLGQCEKIGETVVGPHSGGLGQDQWTEMVQTPRKPVSVWHTLRP